MKNQWQMVVAIVLCLIVAILAVLNVAPVPINLGFTTIEMPLIVLIFVMLLIGVLIAASLSTMKLYKSNREVKTLEKKLAHADQTHQEELKKQLDQKQTEIDQLRSQLEADEQKIAELKKEEPAYMNRSPQSSALDDEQN